MNSHGIQFLGSNGVMLAGRLEHGDEAPRAWALFAHCFTCSKDSRAAVYIARALVEAGFGVLRFDFTGLGGSGGDFSNTDFSSNLDDLVAAADWLRAEHAAPALLIGHSLGGAAVLAAAHRIPEARAVATLAAPSDPAHVKNQFGDKLCEIHEQGEATVQLGGRPFTVRREMLEDLDGQRQAERIRELRRPLLVLHAPLDDVVSIDNASEIFRLARHPKSFVSLDDADHLLSDRKDADYAANVIAAWASRYVTEVQTDEEPASTTIPDGTVHVAEEEAGAYTVAVQAGRHRWLADEPVDVGGDDAGPTPYQMLAAALGACTAMTVRMYANRKQWPLDRVEVSLKHDKIHAKDCEECETRDGRIDRIDLKLTVHGELDEAQRARLLEIAARCPVHRTLHSEVQVRSSLEAAALD